MVGAQQQRWEYRTINIFDLARGERELEILNAAGAEGWELIMIAVNGIATLKRPVVEDKPAPARRRGATPGAAGGAS